MQKPYTLAGVNIIVADTDEEAERISTSLYRMIIGLLTGNRGYMQAPIEMTDELRELSKNPSVRQMLKYSFIGSKETVKKQVKQFIADTQVDELIAVTNIYDGQDRIKSYQLFAAIMREINAEH